MTPSDAPAHLLSALLLVPFIGTFTIALLPKQFARSTALMFGFFMVLLSIVLCVNFDPSQSGMQFVEQATWIKAPFPVNYFVGVDGFSLCLVVLTTVVTLMAIIASESVKIRNFSAGGVEAADSRPRLYYSMVMLLTLAILGVFVSLDLIQFFILYELELVPMYFLIAIWGGPRRDYAAMKFLLYTFFGGIFMLASILYLYFALGQVGPEYLTFDMVKLADMAPLLTRHVQTVACLGFLIAFIIKLPSFPFHTWLPDAHVEAPTPISMILAGLLLKMGSYGLVRICLGFFPEAIGYLGVFLMALGAFNIVWAAIACLVQEDMKRIIAYSSVSHMGFVLLGIGALSAAALNGAIFQMISHGVISALLFFLVGTIYDRCHTRKINELGGGLAKHMPFIFYFWMLAALANLGLPGLSGFVAEVAVFYGSFTSPMVAVDQTLVHTCIIIAGTGVILTAGYMLWLLKRLFYGPEPESPKWVEHLAADERPDWKHHLTDATTNEVFVAAVLSFFIVILGIQPLLLTNNYTAIADDMAREAVEHNHLTISMR